LIVSKYPFTITLVIYFIQFYRMRISGAPYAYGGPWSANKDLAITPTRATLEKGIVPSTTITAAPATKVIEATAHNLSATSFEIKPPADRFVEQSVHSGDTAVDKV
jgi:hypothetical protein